MDVILGSTTKHSCKENLTVEVTPKATTNMIVLTKFIVTRTTCLPLNLRIKVSF